MPESTAFDLSHSGFIHEGTSAQPLKFVQKRWQAIELMGLLENEWDHASARRLEF